MSVPRICHECNNPAPAPYYMSAKYYCESCAERVIRDIGKEPVGLGFTRFHREGKSEMEKASKARYAKKKREDENIKAFNDIRKEGTE